MKILLTFFVLLFSSSVVADDISDFEIEGISIGDSALKYFTEEHIKKNEWDYPDSNKLYTRVQNDELPFFKTYDAVDFHYKTGDKNYIIHNVSGVLFYDNNIEDCYDKMDSIIYELTNIFPNAEKSTKDTWSLTADKSGKSKVTDIYFTLEDGHIIVSCYNYSKEFDGQNHLDIGLDNEEVFKWLQF